MTELVVLEQPDSWTFPSGIGKELNTRSTHALILAIIVLCRCLFCGSSGAAAGMRAVG